MIPQYFLLTNLIPMGSNVNYQAARSAKHLDKFLEMQDSILEKGSCPTARSVRSPNIVPPELNFDTYVITVVDPNCIEVGTHAFRTDSYIVTEHGTNAKRTKDGKRPAWMPKALCSRVGNGVYIHKTKRDVDVRGEESFGVGLKHSPWVVWRKFRVSGTQRSTRSSPAGMFGSA